MSTDLDSLNGVLKSAVSRHKDNLTGRLYFFQFRRQDHPVQVRQIDIDKSQFKGIFPGTIQGLLWVRAEYGMVSFLSQKIYNHPTHERLIIYDKDRLTPGPDVV